jgi:hypothetical protein
MTDSILRLYHGEECDPLRPALPVQANGSEWLPGPPGRITEGILEIDLDAYRKLECPDCGRQHMRLQPQHRGERYRILATCRCGHLEAL